MPTTGCDAISSGGTCYSYFTHTGINWADARLQCLSGGYDIATITSSEENTLLYNIATSNCWIGLNDINTEGTFVWADGNSATYTQWYSGEPNGDVGADCVFFLDTPSWADYACTNTLNCYSCSSTGKRILVWYHLYNL